MTNLAKIYQISVTPRVYIFPFMKKTLKVLTVSLILTGSSFAGGFWPFGEQGKPVQKQNPAPQVQNCPQPEQLQTFIVNLFRLPQIKVVKVQKDEHIPGLCDVVIQLGAQKFVLYTDNSGRYILLGSRGGIAQIVDLKTGENITSKQVELLNKLSEKQVHELDKYVAFTYGHSGKVIYLFTDPECPFCHRIEPILKKLADEGKIQIKVILFPLPFHAHARQKAVAMVCQHIGWEGLRNKYWTPERMEKLEQWQCKEGEEFIKKSIEIAQKYGVQGTPTIITSEGIKIVGALPEAELKRKLGIK
jgi:thiol:disulfide interchange protein DsbC